MRNDKPIELSSMSMNTRDRKDLGIVYTFYSYKGGVGRSMALVNVGVLLALNATEWKKKPRVLLVDWDLEAPGLEVYFENSKNTALQRDPKFVPGILDLLETLGDDKRISWKDCLLEVAFAGTSLDIITSGSKASSEQRGDYRARVQGLDWNKLFYDYDVGNYIENMRREMIRQYDYILIDSRTGTTDIGDICTVLLADVLVLGFISNYQNVDGIANAVRRAHSARAQLPIDRGRLVSVPVPMRDEVYTEYEKSIEWRNIYAKRLGHLFEDWLPRDVSPVEAFSQLFIPYVPIWSFGERIPVLENTRERFDPTTIGAAYIRLANLLRTRIDWRASNDPTTTELIKHRAELGIERSKVDKLQEQVSRSSYEYYLRLAAIMSAAVALLASLYGIFVYVERYQQERTVAQQQRTAAQTARMRSEEGAAEIRRLKAQTDELLFQLEQTKSALQVLEVRGRSPGPIARGLVSPDGKLIVTDQVDGSLNIWAANSGLAVTKFSGGKLRRPLRPHSVRTAGA